MLLASYAASRLQRRGRRLQRGSVCMRTPVHSPCTSWLRQRGIPAAACLRAEWGPPAVRREDQGSTPLQLSAPTAVPPPAPPPLLSANPDWLAPMRAGGGVPDIGEPVESERRRCEDRLACEADCREEQDRSAPNWGHAGEVGRRTGCTQCRSFRAGRGECAAVFLCKLRAPT